MKHLSKILLLIFFLFAHQIYSQEVLKLDIDKSIQIALENNSNLKIAKFEFEKAEEQVDEAWGSAVLPKITGAVNYNRAIKRGEITIETPFFSGSFPQGTKNTMTLSANLEQPLFTGAVFLAIRVAKTYAEISKQMYKQTQSELIVNVKKAYYSVLLSREVLKLSKLNLDLAQENLKNTESMYNAGLVPEYDFVRARVQVQNLKPEVQSAANSLVLSKNMLRIVLGLDLNKEIEITDSLAYVDRDKLNYQAAQELLRKRNFGLKQLKLQIDLQDDNVSYEFSKHFPELYFTSSWQTQAQENDERHFNDWRYKNAFYVGFNLKVPIFNGFQTTSRVQQAELDLQKAKESYDNTLRQLNNQLEEVSLNIEQKKDEIKAYKETIKEAELGYRIASKRFSSGVGTQLEMVDAMVSLTRAKVNYLTAIYDYHILFANYEQLLAEDKYNIINEDN